MSDSPQAVAAVTPRTVPPAGGLSKIGAVPRDLFLIAVCLIAAIPTLYLAAHQFVEYDGYWHVFIAQQDNFQAFWWEYMHNDHPLLFYLLLKVMVNLGRTVLIYRAISVLSALGSIYVLGKIVQKLSSSAFTAPLTALAFGLATPTLEIAISVRSYMLSTFFLLVSFYFFLDLLPGNRPVPRRSRVWFALGAILAVCSHYFAFFYVGACVLLLIGFWMARAPRSWKALLDYGLTFLPIFVVMACLYLFHIRFNKTNLNHVVGYLLVPGESKIKFLLRNLHSIFNFFSPLQIASRGAFEKVAAALAVVVAGSAALARGRARAPLFMFLIILGELALGGLLDRYPFGGFLRQQFIVFPFAALTAGMCLDRLLTAMRAPRASWATAALVGVAVLAISVSRFNAYPKLFIDLFGREMSMFDAAIPAPDAVYVDQFNLIAFFAHHDTWRWHYLEKLPMDTDVEEYSLARNGRRMELLRDKFRWNFDFSDPTLFHDIAEELRSARLRTLAVFCVHQVPGRRTPAQQDAFEQQAFSLAGAQHLQIRKFVPDGLNVYAEFALASQP